MGFCFKCLFAFLVEGSDYGCAQLDPLRRSTSLVVRRRCWSTLAPSQQARDAVLDSPSISYGFCYT
ncbi:hypothetical protein PVAP13_5KG458500 [Panicum virgatum]|uniref:Secreted protein n=1 Tax=Panicum virgatum TaxID=38727 RepID=A0A8T0SPW5_PANVG|nr:hypothetical protein PVAP13_5KG458500 [Panicum virgatum]